MTAPSGHAGLGHAAYELRELHAVTHGHAVEELQLAVWGRSEREVVARDILTALQLQGALLAGAFEARADGPMIGFVFGFPTARAHVQHSHMLAVLPAWRRSGVAHALKGLQRDWCLARGVTRVEWTFDPLRGLNANFNLRKLGATVEGYHEHLYGDMSGINAGVASDRALAVWDIASARVERAMVAGTLPEADFSGVPTVNPDGPESHTFPDAPRLRVALPDDFGALLTQDHALAVRWRLHGRAVLGELLSRGYVATGFSRAGGNAYLMERRKENLGGTEEVRP